MESSQSAPEPSQPAAESSQPSPERTCPKCSAPAEAKQRWCLECGAELPQSRKPALRSAIGIATTLTVLVGAASAGGYTLLQDGKEPPPPAQTQTIAQTPPPVTTPDTAVPPADDALPTTPKAPPLPDAGDGGLGGNPDGGTAAPPAPPADSSVPDLGDSLDTSTPPPPPPSDDTQLDDDGSVRPETEQNQQRRQRPARPRMVETNVAFGSTAAVYAPYATDDVDFGDTSKLVDGTTSSVWKSPRFEDPTVQPQVGVFVELASRERVRKLVLDTPTPGMGVEIYASRNASPPASITEPGWVHLTDRSDIPARAEIPLPGDGRFRYFLVWIRSLAPGTDRAELSEIELIGLAPE